MATSTSKAKKTRTAAEEKVAAEWNAKLKKKAMIFIGLVLVALFLFDLTPFGGSMQFYAKWVECGSRPLTISHPFKKISYYHPAPVVDLLRGPSVRPYFCTALEAEQAGYSASEHQYSFPEKEKLRNSRE